ncbi:hypothetical protein SODALDRAFT_324821 [Sodiomyces alkalinus F11]|uniref:Uncharacterized protein n=1 Tax=Sodiomyces alkalinus (strain CBS 110278 / VKM F-3762 / F11) TaxID=1314773 RepID=A0A3N2PRM7_SODAK|nr:hypothetical protein SODALDRAFT_324821 [Sodiomyces alkalinus F11]ROT37172.1 hypothetical protein SODALDRAFT_324821 [Sodiomyces alkalinus F11]
MVDLISFAGRLFTRDDGNCGPSPCEKPVPTTRIILIVSLTLGGAVVLGTLFVLFLFHRRRQRRDKREDAIADLDLGDDIIEDYPPVQKPRPSRQREQQEEQQRRQQQYEYGSETPNPFGESSRWENTPNHGKSPVMPGQGRSPLLPSHSDEWSGAGSSNKPGGDP